MALLTSFFQKWAFRARPVAEACDITASICIGNPGRRFSRLAARIFAESFRGVAEGQGAALSAEEPYH
jgi:hypothetical protein